MVGGDGVGGGAATSSSSGSGDICPVCGTSQPNLSFHLGRHSKEEIIRAVTIGHPLPDLANRRPAGRPRRPSHSHSHASISPHPSTSPLQSAAGPLVFSGGIDCPATSPIGQIHQPTNSLQAVRLSSLTPLTPLVQTQVNTNVNSNNNNNIINSNNITLATAAATATIQASGTSLAQQQQHGGASGSYILIGNNIIPASNVVSNNIQLGGSGLSYIIPSSNGLMLASPSANQTLIVQNPPPTTTSAAPNTSPIKYQQTFAPPSLTHPVANSISVPTPSSLRREVTESVYIHEELPTYQQYQQQQLQSQIAQQIQNQQQELLQQQQQAQKSQFQMQIETSVASVINGSEANRSRETINEDRRLSPTHSPKKTKDKPIDDKATIQIGKNVSISIPMDLIGRKGRLKEIINQELVRAILMNDDSDEEDEKASKSKNSNNKLKKSKEGQQKQSGNAAQYGAVKKEKADPEFKEKADPEFSYQNQVPGTSSRDQNSAITNEISEVVRCPTPDPLDVGNYSTPSTSISNGQRWNKDGPLSKVRKPKSPESSEYSGIQIENDVPSPAQNVTIENNWDDSMSQDGTLSPYIIVDSPMEVISASSLQEKFAEHLQTSNTSITTISKKDISNTGLQADRAQATIVPAKLNHNFDMSSSDIDEPTNNLNLGHMENIQNIASTETSGNSRKEYVPGTSSDLGSDTEPPLNFLGPDKSFNLLGDGSLEEMVYGEEQVLGAVEEVFASSTSTSYPGQGHYDSSGSLNLSTPKLMPSHKNNNGYLNIYMPEVPSTAAIEDVVHLLREKTGRALLDLKRCKENNKITGPLSTAVHQSNNLLGSYHPALMPLQSSNKNDQPVVMQHQSFQAPSTSKQPPPYLRKLEDDSFDKYEEEMMDDPGSVETFISSEGELVINEDGQLFEADPGSSSGATATEEIMSLKATETLADSDSERATPHEEFTDMMFYERSCMFAGEPGPANLSPRSYPLDASTYHNMVSTTITNLDHNTQASGGVDGGSMTLSSSDVVELSSNDTTLTIEEDSMHEELHETSQGGGINYDYAMSITNLFSQREQQHQQQQNNHHHHHHQQQQQYLPSQMQAQPQQQHGGGLTSSSQMITSMANTSVMTSLSSALQGNYKSEYKTNYNIKAEQAETKDYKMLSQVVVLESEPLVCQAVPPGPQSPVASTSGVQQRNTTATYATLAPITAAEFQKLSQVQDNEVYDFDYESDCYGDSDSDGTGTSGRSGPLDLDHWKCSVCNKMFKSLKEKLLHAGHHSPCAAIKDGFSLAMKLEQKQVKPSMDNKKDVDEDEQDIDDPILIKGKIHSATMSVLEKMAISSPESGDHKEYKCPECKLSYPTAEELFIHRKMVFNSRTICQICHATFDSRMQKTKHLRTHGPEDLRCLICDRQFNARYSWSQHQLFHMGLVMFECKECGRRFQRRSELEVHSRIHTGERPFQCVSCSAAFVTTQALKRHLTTHMEGQEVDCEICNKTYKNSVCLNKHKQKVHSKRKGKAKVRRHFLCHNESCTEVYPSERKLAWHLETHERWPKKCQQCGECFIHQSSLTKHIRQQHNPHHQTTDGKQENNTACPVCRKVFKKSSLALHLRTHTGDKPYKCNICLREFSVKCNLEAHRWTHMGVRDRPHKCKLCDRSFHRLKHLEAHTRSHKNIRPYTCNECGKSFIHKNNLQLHVRAHTGAKDHKCDFCGKAFFRKYNLDNHVRIHTGEMPYECTICRKDFTQKSNYNVHMKAFHVERHSVHEEV